MANGWRGGGGGGGGQWLERGGKGRHSSPVGLSPAAATARGQGGATGGRKGGGGVMLRPGPRTLTVGEGLRYRGRLSSTLPQHKTVVILWVCEGKGFLDGGVGAFCEVKARTEREGRMVGGDHGARENSITRSHAGAGWQPNVSTHTYTHIYQIEGS